MKIRSILSVTAAIAAFTLTPASALAQETAEPQPEQLEEIGETMAALFTSEPLTDVEQARLPAAKAIIDQMMPEGFYAEMMTEMLVGSLEPMLAMFSGPTGADLVLGSRLNGGPAVAGALTDEEKVELATLLDPAFSRRGAVMQELMNGLMVEAATVIEPGFREGMAKAYAVRFDDTQLADIRAFFDTPTGSVYARENMKLMADPQVMSASMQALPEMMQQFGSVDQQMEAAMAELPAERDISEMSAEERARVAALLDVEVSALEEVVGPPADQPRDGEMGES